MIESEQSSFNLKYDQNWLVIEQKIPKKNMGVWGISYPEFAGILKNKKVFKNNSVAKARIFKFWIFLNHNAESAALRKI